MTFSLRLNDEDTKLIKAYAELNNLTVSELFRKAVLERIEDEYDIKAFEEAKAEYEANPVTYTLDEVEKELNLK